jgi:hypothetical protein
MREQSQTGSNTVRQFSSGGKWDGGNSMFVCRKKNAILPVETFDNIEMKKPRGKTWLFQKI